MTPEPQAGPRRRLVQVIGLQRSGNHAIINWIGSLFERPAHLNDAAHDFFARTENVTGNPALAKADCGIVSFEDARGRLGRTELGATRRLLDSVELLDGARFPDFDCRVVHVLRDPYNCWASRVKARETGGLSSPAAMEHFLESWIAMAERCARDEAGFILYNDWFRSRPYRQAACARLGGTYSERTLGEVLGQGRGSSFDGFVRPSYRTILGRLDYYMTPDFRRRFLKAPGSYVARLFAPGIDGRQLQVDSRWEHVVGRDDARALFENQDVRELSRAIFGFHVDAAGRLHRAPPAAGRRAGQG
jgi:hypothetical protein